MLYKSLMSVANYKSGVEQEPAVALVIVEQKHPLAVSVQEHFICLT